MKFQNKTILFVAMQWDYGIEKRGVSGEKLWFLDNLLKLGINTIPFWIDDYLNNKEQLQVDLYEKAKQVKPDLIFFIPYQDQFKVETLQLLKNNYKTYAWFGDDQWRFENFSSRYAPYFDYISTTDPFSVIKYKEIGIKAILSQWAAQTYTNQIGPLTENETYKYEVSFIGGYNETRGWFIKFLSKRGINVECFGAGWPNGRVNYEQMEQIFRQSKINLNLSNSVSNDIRFVLGGMKNFGRWMISKKRSEQLKARNFEIPLAGGFQLANYVLNLEQYWIIGSEIVIYNSPEECIQQIHYYLNNEKKRREIVEVSHKKASEEHTYINRISKILEEIWV